MKKILITGASDGIGKALALMLDEKGYKTYLFGRNPEKLNSLKLNNCLKKYAFDLKDRDKLNEALNDIRLSGGVDILINNAGFNYKKEEVKDAVQTEIQFTDDTNVEDNKVKEGTNTEEGTVVAVPSDNVDNNTPEIFDPDNMYNDYTRDDNNDDAGYNNNDDEGSLYSNSKDILFSDEEIVINNYANNPTYNPNGVVTVSKMDDYLNMFPIEERALVAQNLENGNVNYVCR